VHPGGWHKELARVESLSHQHVDLVRLKRLVHDSLGLDVSVELTLLLLGIKDLLVLSFLDFIVEVLDDDMLFFDHAVQLF
jgi:hypothetical protein